MTSFELYLVFVFLFLLWLAVYSVRSPFRRVTHKAEELAEGEAYSHEAYREEARPDLWYLAGIDWTELGVRAPHPLWIDHALNADYRRHARWQDPTILAYYAGRDLRTTPDWEPRRMGFMENFWWVAVVVFSMLVFGGLIWGLMNRAGA